MEAGVGGELGKARFSGAQFVRPIRSVCVFCGAREGGDPAYAAAAERLGETIAEAGLELVYGGGRVGLMGRLSRAAIRRGGSVIGVIPRFLVPSEGASEGLKELIVVETMHERKRIMFERADAFIALPGGVGTLDELAEQVVWGQLGRHSKPIVLADVRGFWRPLIMLLDHMRAEGFLHDLPEHVLRVAPRIEDVLDAATTVKIAGRAAE